MLTAGPRPRTESPTSNTRPGAQPVHSREQEPQAAKPLHLEKTNMAQCALESLGVKLQCSRPHGSKQSG